LLATLQSFARTLKEIKAPGPSHRRLAAGHTLMSGSACS
jgi:hypothetical protein